MYSLDNDSFLTSLEAMTIPTYWTETIKHTKLQKFYTWLTLLRLGVIFWLDWPTDGIMGKNAKNKKIFCLPHSKSKTKFQWLGLQKPNDDCADILTVLIIIERCYVCACECVCVCVCAEEKKGRTGTIYTVPAIGMPAHVVR